MAKNPKKSAVVVDEFGVERITGIEKAYNDKTHFYGRIWAILAIIVFMAIPFSMSLHYGEWPVGSAFAGAAVLIIFTTIGGIGENLMYTTLMGPTASYVAFLTGNISNLKFPCTIAALDTADVDVHSDEGEVAATIAVCVSSIVTVVTIALFCAVLSPLIPIITDPTSLFYPAFQQVVPALFGAILVPYCIKNPRLWQIPLIVMAVLYWLIPSLTATYGMIISIILALLLAFVFYRLGWLEDKPEKKKVPVDLAAASADIQEDQTDINP